METKNLSIIGNKITQTIKCRITNVFCCVVHKKQREEIWMNPSDIFTLQTRINTQRNLQYLNILLCFEQWVMYKENIHTYNIYKCLLSYQTFLANINMSSKWIFLSKVKSKGLNLSGQTRRDPDPVIFLDGRIRIGFALSGWIRVNSTRFRNLGAHINRMFLHLP